MHDCVVLAAARGVGAEVFSAACPTLPRGAVAAGGGWVWAALSAYSADLPELADALGALDAAVLLMKSRPFAVEVTLVGKGRRHLDMMWHWGLAKADHVAELERRHASDVKRLLSRGEFEVSAATKKVLKGASFPQACAAVLEGETSALVKALGDAGMVEEEGALQKLLAVLPEAELAWAVGALPRLLDGLGLVDVFRSYPAARGGGWLAAATDEVTPFLAAVPEGVEITGGPVSLAVGDLPRVALMLSMIDSESHLAVRVTGAAPAEAIPFRRDDLHLQVVGDEIRAALPLVEFRLRDAGTRILAALAPALAAAGPAHGLELLARRLGKGAGGVRLAGDLDAGRWLIRRASPVMTRETLEDLLSLAAAVETGAPITIRSDEEAAAVAAKMKWNQRYWNALAKDGLSWTAGPTFNQELLAVFVAAIRYGSLSATAKPVA